MLVRRAPVANARPRRTVGSENGTSSAVGRVVAALDLGDGVCVGAWSVGLAATREGDGYRLVDSSEAIRNRQYCRMKTLVETTSRAGGIAPLATWLRVGEGGKR